MMRRQGKGMGELAARGEARSGGSGAAARMVVGVAVAVCMQMNRSLQ